MIQRTVLLKSRTDFDATRSFPISHTDTNKKAQKERIETTVVIKVPVTSLTPNMLSNR
jgi:hypothetical protein